MVFIFILIALFLAMNVGANNSVAEMGAAYGKRCRTRRETWILLSVFIILGAIITGLPVLKTLGEGLVPAKIFKTRFYIILTVMVVAAFFDLIANEVRIVIPNSYAIVSSIATVGFYYKMLSVSTAAAILKWWIFSPLAAFVAALSVGKIIRIKFLRSFCEQADVSSGRRILNAALTFSGCYAAFAAAANGAAKAFAPIVAAGMVDNRWGILLGGIGIAAGTLIFGRAALKKDSKEKVELGFIKGITIEIICATVLLLASIKGIPLSVSVTVTSSLIGLGCADSGFFKSAKRHHLIKTLFIWLLVPFLSAVLTYSLLRIFNLTLG